MTRFGYGLAAGWLLSAVPALAAPSYSFSIESQDMGRALEAFAAATGREVLAASEAIAGKRSNEVRGALTPEEAITRLLAGTGLRYEIVDAAFIIKRALGDQQPSAPDVDPGIVVTGTRIRGSDIASPRITLRADAMKSQGLGTLTEAARTIPQNFGGGQNPTVGINVPASSGVNVGGGSSLNLRGLGSDATLTLINGRRLSYSASRQSVDLSAIPVGIVDRIEIVADGSSAIYGSDAVAGVANIVWRRDMEGLDTTVRIGGSTDGGNDQRISSATGGASWSGGGGIVAYEYGFNSPITGAQRSYARTTGARGLDLLPQIERHNVALSVHHSLGSVTASLDALFNNRRTLMTYALNASGDRNGLFVQAPSQANAFLVAPSISVDLGRGWQGELSGSYGSDKLRYAANVFRGPAPVSTFQGCYCNDILAGEAAANGPVFSLPAGPVRLAIGVGVRDIGFESFRGVNSPQNVSERQSNAYTFAETSLPVVGRGYGAALLRATAALRYERYPGLADVATPKLGLIFSPSGELDLKASWGRSFRAPTMLQRYETSFAVLYDASALGGSGLPAGSTVLLVSGGRPGLEPERARSWSVTADVHPRALEGVRLELSYFDTRYRDRIVTPIAFSSQALSNPIYADQVLRAPGRDLASQTAANAAQFFNVSSGAFDPALVVAIVDNASVNASTQHIRGVDGAFTLSHTLGDGADRIRATLSASYLVSSQRLTDAQPEVPLAGRLFNPPHLRARSALGWSNALLSLTGAVTYTGGVTDPRFATPVEVRSLTAFDLTVHLTSPATAGLAEGLEVIVTAQNLFNAKPQQITNTLRYDNP